MKLQKFLITLLIALLLFTATPVLAHTPLPETAPQQSVSGGSGCDAPMFLSLNDWVSVTPGIPNNVRAQPNLNATITGRFPTGAAAQVTAGPICANGLRWWQVVTEGFGGWTAEGDASGHWLVRLNRSPLLNHCPLLPRLNSGEYGAVTPGSPNVLRNGPDQHGTSIVGQIPGGGQFLVLGTSLCGTDGRRWFPVNYNGTLGWTAEGEGSTYWLTPATVYPPPPTNPPTSCSMPTRLSIGMFVTVSAGLPNRVHSDAYLSAPVTGRLPNGDVAQILNGPICADGLRWWHVGNEVVSGWTAEGDNSEYWLVPLLRSPYTNYCPLAPRLVAGNNARVLPGDANALRNGPDQHGTTVIGNIPGGAYFTVLGNSICGTDGRRWYPVRYNGTLGWTAEGEGSTYWLAPA